MDQTTGGTRIDRVTDLTVRHRRMEALQRAHRARAVLDRHAELVGRDGTPGTEDGDAARAEAFRDDVARLEEIHRNLLHERHVARRLFHRHSERLVLALELAERLALDRLGFRDFADFEAHRADDGRERLVIDVDLVEQAARDLAEAEAVLAELDGPGPIEPAVGRLPTWTVDPALRPAGRLRATTARRQLFGDPAALRPARPATHDIVIADWPLPFRPRAGGRPVAPAEPLPRRRADQERVLGEIVRHGRRVRIERMGDLLDDEADDPERRITYGEPERPG